MSDIGQTRPWRHLGVESVLSPTSDIAPRGWDGRKVHKTGTHAGAGAAQKCTATKMLISGLSIDNRKKSTTEAFLTKRDQGRPFY
jgi:hypothetical protein